MRILFLYDFPLWGSGSGTYIRKLAQELLKLNHTIGIVCPETRRFLPDKIKQYRANPLQIPVFVGHPELPGAKRYSELSDREITEIYKSYIDTTLDAVANFNPDIIHVHHLSLISWVAKYVSALRNIKYILTSHGSCLYAILDDQRYLPLSESAVKSAAAITLVSNDSQIKFLQIFGKGYSKNTSVIPGGVDMGAFPSKVKVGSIDKKYKLKNKKMVLFTGRLISHKGVEYLIRAAKDIKGEVFIIGDGPEKHYLESLIKSKNLKNVHLIGYVMGDEINKFYYRADIFVAPSVWDEPLGLTVLEAMASKTPVVATRKGGIPLLVKNGYNGLFVPAKNSQKIAWACNKLLDNEDLRKKMAENARKTVAEKFSWKKTALKFHYLYKKIRKNNKNHKR